MVFIRRVLKNYGDFMRLLRFARFLRFLLLYTSQPPPPTPHLPPFVPHALPAWRRNMSTVVMHGGAIVSLVDP